ncbi:hypothetical protein [Priestia aryabhattai]|uniref:hypothetical protein n=1 Tax=Priestia aryabhattai TaxID=412384 RepID=UPI001875FE89|nr:hypothetical protein [Priestia aryabhattai]MBE5100293.1 hypothetical protein [Priestia aryabhattai]
MEMNWTKKLFAGGMAAALTLGGLAGCGDGVDQDNGVSDGEQKDEIDKDTKAKQEQAKKDLENQKDKVDKKLKENGVNDGVDQDNGPSDGKDKDDVDDENKKPETN